MKIRKKSSKPKQKLVDNKNYFNFVQLILDRKDYYRITLEESKDGKIIINAICANFELDPLVTASGYKLKKQETLQDGYRFTINEEVSLLAAYIGRISIWV